MQGLTTYWKTPDIILRGDWIGSGINTKTDFESRFNITNISSFKINGELLSFDIDQLTTEIYIDDVDLYEVVQINTNILENFSVDFVSINEFKPAINSKSLLEIGITNSNLKKLSLINHYPSVNTLFLADNNIEECNLTPLYKDLTFLYLNNCNLTLSNYTELENWANALVSVGGTFNFDANTDSVLGTNLQITLMSKGHTVIG